MSENSGDQDSNSINSQSTISEDIVERTTPYHEPLSRMMYRRQVESNRYSRHINFDAYKSELNRLQSFSQTPGWPVTFIRPEDCASVGFFYIQDGDKVQCAFCGGVAGEWEQGDNPMIEHRRHFPRCPFICGLPVGNIPLVHQEAGAEGLSNQDEITGVNMSRSFAPVSSQLNFTTDETPSGGGMKTFIMNGNEDLKRMGILICENGPAHPSFVTASSRIKTFVNWPAKTGQSPDVMAEAGFFYTGEWDHVQCFYCNGVLCNWRASDDPWLEHAHWFPNCNYIILNKGVRFEIKAKKNKPKVLSEDQQQPQSSRNEIMHQAVSDQVVEEIMSLPDVQVALERVTELDEVKRILKREMQLTKNMLFLTTEPELQGDSEYDSDSDTDVDDNAKEENLSTALTQRPSFSQPNNISNLTSTASFTDVGYGNSVEATSISSSSSEHSSGSGDENVISSTLARPLSKAKSITTSGSGSDDSGVGSVKPESSISKEDKHVEKAIAKCLLDKETDLDDEVQKLREQTLCKMCVDNQVGVVFLPCGHLVSCTQCATSLLNCALCRKKIKGMIRTYMS